jgi:hypothetical protein
VILPIRPFFLSAGQVFFVPAVWYLTRFPAAAGIFVSDVFIVS